MRNLVLFKFYKFLKVIIGKVKLIKKKLIRSRDLLEVLYSNINIIGIM